VNTAAPGDPLPTVVSDNRGGGRAAADHLLALGHRRFGYLMPPPRNLDAPERLAGVRDALAAAGIGRDDLAIADGAPTVTGGESAMASLLETRPQPTAVVAYNDLMAIGLMHGLQRARVAVPRQVSVVGFDNIFGSDFCTPALTTVAAPLRALGAAGVRRLLAQLGGAKARPAQPEVLPVRLVVRASTAQRSRKRSSPARGTTSVSGSAAQASGSTAAGSR
jgi:LacI family transcriptional regulator, repressor for deo operon, udp, cdd, tsx, nupC, and nupG